MDTDRNLLFAVLALQAGLIDRERFLQACTQWATRKEVPIADLLVAQGWLTAEARGLVEQLLAVNLRQHGNHAGTSLAAAAGAEARRALASVADADVEQSLAGLPGRVDPTVPAPDLFGTVVSAEEPAGRTVLYEEIGRGGMGRVLRGRDNDLRRDLAVKVLREEYSGKQDVERRFVEEAQIGGQLQHPGVVPVYELGRFPDSRPFFTMKLVKGRTLAELLKDRPDLRHDQGRFLAIFEQVCQTLAYAHSKGVIHRDLKPQNVMVGAFGEVQVMDWGLAKVLARPKRATTASPVAMPSILTERSDTAGEDSLTGVIGTPAFMPPEQARGEVEAVDERADVFGLGGILCVILTGQPPYAALEPNGVLRKAAGGDVPEAFARLDGCGADAELVALCKACLAPAREQRPRDAGEVAARMAAYTAAVQERLRAAELERAAAEARAEEETRTRRVAEAKTAIERRARRLTVGLAAAVLLLLVVGGGAAWWAQQERQARAAAEVRRRQEIDAAAVTAMNEARLLLDQAKGAPLGDPARFREALAAASKARDLARPGEASDDVASQATDLVEAVKKETDTAGRDRQLLAALLEVRSPHEGPKFQKDDQGLLATLPTSTADEQFRAAFRMWDPTFDLDALPTEEAATRLKGRPAAVVTEVVAALDEWASERRRQLMPQDKWQPLADLASALEDDPNSHARQLRDILGRGNLYRERALGALSMGLRPVPVPFDALLGGDRRRLQRLVEDVDAAREPVLRLLTLARALQVAGDNVGAERLLRAAVRSRPREVVLHYELGKLLEGQQPPRWREAVGCYAAVRALRPELGESLANALVMSGWVDEGQALYERLLVENQDNPWLYFRRGYALRVQGRYKEAEAALREAEGL